MKNSILLMFAICCLTVSCKKEEKIKMVTFFPELSNASINFDSLSYAIVNYIDAEEINDTTDFYNQDVYTHSETTALPITLALTAEHTYVFKKFDIYDKSDNLRYYVPYQTGSRLSGGFELPFAFKVNHVSQQIDVIKK